MVKEALVSHGLLLALGAITVTLVPLTPRVASAQRSPSVRRGAPGVVVPMTEVSVTLGGRTVTGSVDAKCQVDARATPNNTRFYFSVMYPWFGQRVAPNKPQWRLDLGIRRGATTEASDRFTFSFRDGDREAIIQTVADAERMGRGTVAVRRVGEGARFEVEGRSKQGDAVRATIVCSAFVQSEKAGG